MKAAIVTTPGVLTVQDIEPPIVGEYEALCEMLYGAICTGTDSHLIDGEFPWPVNYPTILGHESIGRVVRVGAKVRYLKPGDVVTRVGTTAPPGSGLDVNWGGFAEQGIARDHWAMREDGLPESEWRPAAINQIVPPDIDPAAATMMITWRETLDCFNRMQIPVGGSLLVSGTGGNGLAFVAHAKNAGVGRIAIVGSPARAEIARRIGATDFFDYRSPDLAAEISALQPDGFDMVLDAVGKQDVLNAILPHVSWGGRLTIYGLDDHGSLSLDLSRARGTFTYYVGGYEEALSHDQVVELMRSGELDARNWIDLDHPFELENIADAFNAVRGRAAIKAVVRLSRAQ